MLAELRAQCEYVIKFVLLVAIYEYVRPRRSWRTRAQATLRRYRHRGKHRPQPPVYWDLDRLSAGGW